MFRKMLKAVGGLLIAFGVIWGMQGLGLLDWPADSFMLGRSDWALYGAVMALTGMILLWHAGRN